VGATLTLDADHLLGAARDAAGLDDLDDDTLPSRLADLVAHLAGRLDTQAAAAAAAVIHAFLVQRLQFFDDRKHHPIAAERIEQPIITFGEARSGTTLLQMLLGCDPDARLLEFWEVMYSSPPPGISDTTERRRRADEDWREILDLIPRWLVSHPYNGMLGRNPPECERLWAFDFRTLTPTGWWRVPGAQFPTIALPQDHARQYEIHRMMLQHLQYGAPSKRWVLKGTSHQHRLPALLDAYPDGIFVWIHRDPLAAIASRFELVAQVYEGINGGHLDRSAFARAVVESSVANFTATATSPAADDPRIHHLLYEEFMADTVGTIRSLYERVDLDFTDRFTEQIAAWSAANPPNRYGRFTYAVDALGVDLADLDGRLEPNRQRFGVAREHPKET
jgi:hypothetical protein